MLVKTTMATLGSNRPTRLTLPTRIKIEQYIYSFQLEVLVLKKVGKNMIHKEHVMYIVIPICFASLKFLGKLRVLKAKTVQRNMSSRL